MGSNRIQKLLFSEYSDLEDTVLIESPFAETNREGRGIRQVQIGLTPSKLVLAEYCVVPLQEGGGVKAGPDPDIDSFELVCAYPVDCVNLTVYRHQGRRGVKASFSTGKVHYYEIGGWQERKMLWSIWCERIKFLAPYASTSETSVTSNSSGTSLYISRSHCFPTASGKPLLWCHYSSTSQADNSVSSWSDPHVYLGPSFLNKGVNFTSLPHLNSGSMSFISFEDVNKRNVKIAVTLSVEHEVMAREAVDLWESQASVFRRRPRRLYALSPCPELLSGLGLRRLSRVEARSLQVLRRKRSVSEVQLQEHCREGLGLRLSSAQLLRPRKRGVSLVQLRECCGEDMGLRLSSAQLLRTVSLETLVVPALSPDKLLALAESSLQSRKSLSFCTTEEGHGWEWRRNEYQKQQRHLRLLRKRSSTTVVLWQKEVKKSKQKPRPKSTITSKCATKIWVENRRHQAGGGDSADYPSQTDDKGYRVSSTVSGVHRRRRYGNGNGTNRSCQLFL